MRGFSKVALYALLVLCASSLVGSFAKVSADRYSSTNYTIDASVNGGFGGQVGSTNYGLYDTGGEPIIGNGTSGSYLLNQGYINALNKSIRVAVQPAGLLAYFPLDEGSGTVVNDSSATSQSAYFTGTPTWSGSGQVGGSLGAFTTSNYAKTTATTTYDSTSFTVCAWANSTATSSNPFFVTRMSGSIADNMWGLGFNTATKAKASMRLSGTQYDIISSFAGVGTGVWSHNCMSYDGTTFKLYVNGQLAGSTTISLAVGSNAQPITIGGRSNGATPFNGYVDEVKYYNRALSLDEISAMYTGEAAGLQAGVGLGTITSGTSNIANFDTIVETDSSSYDLSISSNHDLQNGANTIPAVSGSIATPGTWVEGTTKGLGFTISAASGLDAKWNSGAKYAAFPASDTTFYSRDGFSGGGIKDVVNMQARVDVNITQATGFYSAQFTVTGTTRP